jgi:hypothetical protein
MVIHDKWPVEHDAKSLVFDETSHFLHNLLASRDLAVRTEQTPNGLFWSSFHSKKDYFT